MRRVRVNVQPMERLLRALDAACRCRWDRKVLCLRPSGVRIDSFLEVQRSASIRFLCYGKIRWRLEAGARVGVKILSCGDRVGVKILSCGDPGGFVAAGLGACATTEPTGQAYCSI